MASLTNFLIQVDHDLYHKKLHYRKLLILSKIQTLCRFLFIKRVSSLVFEVCFIRLIYMTCLDRDASRGGRGDTSPALKKKSVFLKALLPQKCLIKV